MSFLFVEEWVKMVLPIDASECEVASAYDVTTKDFTFMVCWSPCISVLEFLSYLLFLYFCVEWNQPLKQNVVTRNPTVILIRKNEGR